MRKYRIIGSLLLLAVMCVACNPDSGKKKISIAYANWLEGIAMSHLAKVVLEEVYDSARVGLVVPQYVTIDSIGELAAHKGQFSSEIVGIDAGAGIMKTTDKAIGDYGLDGYKLLTSSSSTMLASLQKAMEKEAWIVITGWTPHWMFDRYPLKFLHDPKGTYGNVESIYVVGWKGFTEKDPFAAKFFSNIKFTTEEISSLMKALKDARMDEEDLVRKWRDEHRELVESWIPES